MYRKLFLICFGILFTLLSVNTVVADYDQDLDNAKIAEYNQRGRTDTHYAKLDHAGDLLRSIEGTYTSNQKAISDGKKVALVGALGVSSLPSALSTLVSVLGLSGSINNSSELLSAYETAIGKKQSTIQVMKDSIVAYNRIYNKYLDVYELHMGSPSHTLSSSSSHTEVSQKVWSPLDYYLPTFSCIMGCGTGVISTPTEAIEKHRLKCGSAENVEHVVRRQKTGNIWSPHIPSEEDLLSRSVSEGCGRFYYSCQSGDVSLHSVQTCKKSVWEDGKKLDDPCNVSFRSCMGWARDHRNAWWSLATPHDASSDSETDDTSGSSSTSPPADGTPNCPDCTSHCSSPCSCTNSGTCNGTVSYHACGDHETSVSGSHSYGTYTCGSHSGYACQESNDHKTYISSCTSTNSDGNTCNNSSAYYECSQHSHTYPPSLVACGGASYTGCSGASSRTEHHVESCSSGCGNGYWTCSSTAVYDHETTFTCRRPGCGSSFTRCTNSTCTSDWGTYTYHWAQ